MGINLYGRELNLLVNFKVGDKVEVRFELVGKKVISAGKSMVFNTLKVDKITLIK